jgi:outer membrane protein assembly factor BamA
MLEPEPPKTPVESKVYYGGSLGLSFGSYFRLAVTPMVGYKLSPRASLGLKFQYEYTVDSRYAEDVTSHNYGGSVFARFSITPRVYAHAEFAEMSYKYASGNYTSEREWVPFILLGGGFVQPISPKTAFFVEVLFDVLQDPKSPYEQWTPWISAGVSAGF